MNVFAEFQNTANKAVWLPHEVVKATLLGDVSLIRAWREYFGLTQQELALRTGMSQPTLALLEKGDTEPRTATLKKLAAAMDISVAQLTD
jgi:predicted transcriptional regulator